MTLYCRVSRFVKQHAFGQTHGLTRSEQFGVRMACLRFRAGGLALCGAERRVENGVHQYDPVRQASLSKAEASRPHSKFSTNPYAR